jgi:hypothetical protein
MVKMIEDAGRLGIQMDEFYSRCHRLTGYGLALPLTDKHGSMGNPNVLPFRMTLLGKRLIDILINVARESLDVYVKKRD